MDQSCAKCGANVPDGAKFCLACGSQVISESARSKFCMHCGAALPAGAKYCLQCGGAAEISAAAAPAIAVTPEAHPPWEAPAPVKPVEVPAEARTADMIQYYYRRSKAIRNVVLAVPIVAYVIILITHYHGLLPVLSDIWDFLTDGNIRDGFVVTAIELGFILPFWIISGAIIRGRRLEAIRAAGMDSNRFKAALHQYNTLKKEGKLRPVVDPGPIPEDVTTAVAIRSRYRKRSATAQIILYVLWLLFVMLFPLLFDLPEGYVIFSLCFFGFTILYTIFHFAAIIPLLRRKRKNEYEKAGFDGERFLELLYQYKTLKREKKQWAVQENARKLREETERAAERLASAAPAPSGKKSGRWLITFIIVIALICGLYYGGFFGGGDGATAGKKTIQGLYVDSEGMKRLTFNRDLVYPPDLILFTSSGDVYFSQFTVVHSDAEMMQYGNHYTYTISGNTITIGGNTDYTGTISGNTITLVGKVFVPSDY